MRYEQLYDGEWVKPGMRGYKTMCCDCSLVHKIDFKIVKKGKKGWVVFRAFRDNRATARARKRNNK